MFTLFLIAFLINGTIGDKINTYNTRTCVPKTRELTITNTQVNIAYNTITSTVLEHGHTVLPVTNTIIVPSITLSTLTVTWLEPGTTVTSTSTVEHSTVIPVKETVTHTIITNKSTQVKLTEVEVQSMTLTQTKIKPYTSTYTTPRFVEVIISTYSVTTTTLTDWKTVTTKKPIFVTWTNFITYDIHATKTIFKTQSETKHVSTTITKHTTLMVKC